MPSIMDMVQEHLGGDGVAQLTQHLGVDQGTAQAAAAAALPMLVNAMSSRMSSPGAAPMPSSDAGNLGAAGGLLGNLLGGDHAEMSQQVSKHSGLDIHQAEKALLFLAPIVMAQLAKKRQQAGTPPAGSTSTAQPNAQPGGLGGVIDAVERIFHKGS